MSVMEDPVLPPSVPPPLLSDEQLIHLATQGWLPITLPEHLSKNIAALSAVAESYFKLDSTRKFELYPTADGTECGYYIVENEKEYLTLRSAVHPSSGLETAASTVWRETATLLHRILHDLTRALDIPSHAFSTLLDGCLTLPATPAETTPTLLRLFNYFPRSGFATTHTDLGLLTLCVGSGGPGLQVLVQPFSKEESRWIDAAGPTVLAGSTLRVLSRGLVRDGNHRVIENPHGRTSTVFALRPSLRHPIDLAVFGGEGTVEAKELWARIRMPRTNINATKDIRERQREELKTRREAETSSAQEEIRAARGQG